MLGRFNTLSPEVKQSLVGKNYAQIADAAKTAPPLEQPALNTLAGLLKPNNVRYRADTARPSMGPQLNAALDEARGEATQLKNRALGEDFPMTFGDVAPGTAGHTDLQNITIGAHVLDPKRVAAHEVGHILLNRLSSSDRRLVDMSLTDGSARMKELQTWAQKQPNSERILHDINTNPEERAAYYFEAKRMGDLNPSGLFGRIMDKMNQMVEKIGNVFKGHGFTNLDDLVHAAYEGKMPTVLRRFDNPTVFNRADTEPQTFHQRITQAEAARQLLIQESENLPKQNFFRAFMDRLGVGTDSLKAMASMAAKHASLRPVQDAMQSEHMLKTTAMSDIVSRIKDYDAKNPDWQKATEVARRLNLARLGAPDTDEANAALKAHYGMSDAAIRHYHAIRDAANAAIETDKNASIYLIDSAMSHALDGVDQIREEMAKRGLSVSGADDSAEGWLKTGRETERGGSEVARNMIGLAQKIRDYLDALPASERRTTDPIPGTKEMFGTEKSTLDLQQDIHMLEMRAKNLDTIKETTSGLRANRESVMRESQRLKDEGYIPSMSKGRYHVSVQAKDGFEPFARAVNVDDRKAGEAWAKNLAEQRGYKDGQYTVTTSPVDSLPESMQGKTTDIFKLMEATHNGDIQGLDRVQKAQLLHSMLDPGSALHSILVPRADILLPDEDVLNAIHSGAQMASGRLARYQNSGALYRAYNEIADPRLKQYAAKYIDYQRSQLSSVVSMVRKYAALTLVHPIRAAMYTLAQNLPMAAAHLAANGGKADLMGWLARMASVSHDDLLDTTKGLDAFKGINPAYKNQMRAMLQHLEKKGVTDPQLTQNMWGFNSGVGGTLGRLRDVMFLPTATIEARSRRAVAAAAIQQAYEKFAKGEGVKTFMNDEQGSRLIIKPSGDKVVDEQNILRHAEDVVNRSMQTYDKTNLRPVYRHKEASLMSQFSEPTMQAIGNTFRLFKSDPVVGSALMAYFGLAGGLAGMPALTAAKSLGNMAIAGYNKMAPQFGAATTPDSLDSYQHELVNALADHIQSFTSGKLGDAEFWRNALNNGIFNPLTGENIGAFANLGSVGNLSGIDLQNDLGAGRLADIMEGPYLSAIGGTLAFGKDVAAQNWNQAIHDIPVSVLKRLALAGQSAATGRYITRSGKYTPVTPLQSAMFALGFDPQQTANYYNNTLPQNEFAQSSLELEQKELSELAHRAMSGLPESNEAKDKLVQSMTNWNREHAQQFGHMLSIPNFGHAAMPYVMPFTDPAEQYLMYHNFYGLI